LVRVPEGVLDVVEADAVGVEVGAFVVVGLVGVAEALLLDALAVGLAVVGVLVVGVLVVGLLDAVVGVLLAVPGGVAADLEKVRSTQYWLACHVFVGK
jgi:hypothetical protein